MKVNYYDILGVDRSATEQVIRDKFRQLARESHPDRYKGPNKAEAERKFQTLTEDLIARDETERFLALAERLLELKPAPLAELNVRLPAGRLTCAVRDERGIF